MSVRGRSGTVREGVAAETRESRSKEPSRAFRAGSSAFWRVSGRTIHVSPQCELAQEIGPVAIGAFVEIVGQMLSDGSMNATKIEVKSNPAGEDGRDDLKGTIFSILNFQSGGAAKHSQHPGYSTVR